MSDTSDTSLPDLIDLTQSRRALDTMSDTSDTSLPDLIDLPQSRRALDTMSDTSDTSLPDLIDFPQSRRALNSFGSDSASDEDSDDPTASSDFWSNPKAFFDSVGNLPKPSSFPTAAEVRNEARERAKKIFDDWTLINRIVECHEATIRKRWLKKTRGQRKTILLTSWPDMSLSHRPDIAAFIRESQRRPTKFKEAYLWPHINQEDLLKPKLFLIFLNARARNFPSVFASADDESVRFGITARKLSPAFLHKHTMMFTGRNTPETYGELLAWDEHEDASSWLYSQRGVHPGYGLQILETQRRVYGFLLECCLLILQDMDMSRESLFDSTPIQPEPPSLSIAEPGVNSLAAVAAEAPYRLPASIDLARLQSLVAARRLAMEDHVWSLREDPSYFAEVLSDTKEHRQELLPDIRGRAHSLLRPYPGRRFWDRVAGNVIAEAYSSLAIWDDIHSQIGNLKLVKQKYADQISYENDLPSELLEAFLTLNFSLERYVKGPILRLKTAVPPSPPLRAYFERLPEDGDPNIIRVEEKMGKPKDKTYGRVMWIFQTLWDDQQRHLAGLHTLMDEMERLVENETRARELLSARVVSTIADLSALSECQHQIALYQPWASTFETEAADRGDDLQADYVKRTSLRRELDTALKQITLADLADPSDGRFFYPVDKRRTRENTEAMQKAERRLDKFWEMLDKQLMRKADLSQHEAFRRLLSAPRILRRTPNWVEPDPAVRPEDGRGDTADELCRPFSQLYSELEHRTQSTVDSGNVVPPKAKIKTRGAPLTTQPSVEEPPALAEQGDIPDIQPTFTVDKRALKVFSTLFYKPSRASQPGEVPWNDFLHAMRATGFAVEKLYGSVWQFTPSTLDVERSIQFHEPHPSGKIAFRMARRFGRRLWRAYGWNGDIFKLDGESCTK
jgi:hypothetical protein